MRQDSWAETEDAVLRTMHSQGATRSEIQAAVSTRTLAAVDFRLRSFGLSPARKGPDRSQEQADVAILKLALERGLSDRDIHDEDLPHRSTFWIEKHRLRNGFKRQKSLPTHFPDDESPYEIKVRLKAASNAALELMRLHHSEGCSELNVKSGTPKSIVGDCHGSIVTSMADLCVGG